MIEFSCPKCDADLEAESDDAGTKLACPECGQVMTVPGGKPAKKGNAAITPQKSSPQSLTRRPTPAGAGVSKSKRLARDEDEDLEEDVDDDEGPSKKKGSSKGLWITLGVGGGLVVVALAVAGVMMMGGDDKKSDAVANNSSKSTSSTSTPVAPPPPGGGANKDGAAAPPPPPPGGSTDTKTAAAPEKKEETQGGAFNEQKRGAQIYQRLLKSTVLILASIRDTIGREAGPEISYVEEPGAENPFSVYGKGGTPCPRCKTRLHRIVQGARGTVFCPKCQRG